MSDLYRQLPAVHDVLADERVADLPREVAVACARSVLDDLRAAIGRGELQAVPDVPGRVAEAAAGLLAVKTRRVINATGVVVHTNLGRAPWSEAAIRAATGAAGYCALEMELDSGLRGGRLAGARRLLRHLTGAEDAVVVNNGAAAVLLALTALARGREVVLSRGEMVEIGGSFRVPEVVASGGARLVEVGTTNRTRIGDYAAAVGEDTAVLLVVHPSNFRVEGFTEAAGRDELVALAAERGVLLVEDLGSGSLGGEGGEPGVRAAVEAGVDLAVFSGDKLLGGPQAGVAVGRAAVVERLRRHPMYRALRLGKVGLAALEATLADHAAGRQVPVQAMLGASEAALEERAEALREALSAAGVEAGVEADVGYTGGGALAARELPTRVVTIEAADVEGLVRALRLGDPPVVARIAEGVLRLDVRTLSDAEVAVVADRVATATREGY